MKNKIAHRSLGRVRHNRIRLMRSLTSALLEHGHIVTTEAKAKELRMYIEPLITKARGDITLAKRRALIQKLNKKEDLERLVDLAKINSARPGGYIRLTKMPVQRSDSAPVMRVDTIQ